MNGSRSTYMRKGYLLTALAAAVLLAASSGTAQAQTDITPVEEYYDDGINVDVRGLFTINEGSSVEVEVSIRAMVEAGNTSALDVVLAVAGVSDTTTSAGLTPPRDVAVSNRDLGAGGLAEAGDYSFDNLTGNSVPTPTATRTSVTGNLTLSFDANTSLVDELQTVTEIFVIDAESDSDAENEGVALTITYAPGSGLASGETLPVQSKQFIIYDDEDQEYILELGRRAEPVEGGDPFNVTLEAEPEFESGSAALTLAFFDQDGNRDRRNYKVDVGAPTLNAGNMSQQALMITADTDKNRVPDTVTLSAFRGSAAGGAMVASLDIEVADIHTLAAEDDITAMAMDKAKNGDEVMEIEEGGDPVYLTITVDRGSGKSATTKEPLTIDVRAADLSQANDYEVTPSRVELDAVTTANGKQSTEVEIMLLALDNDDVGDEELVLNLEVSGESKFGTETSTGTFTITIIDDTEPKVWPLPEAEAYPAITDAIEAGAGDDEELNPGESFSVMTSDLFGLAEGYDADYRASVEGGAVSVSTPGDTITVDAKEAGKAKVTITATAKMMASSSFKSEQTVSDKASITFEVMVADKVLVVMLEMPANVMDGNIVEGESYDIMVSANRKVHEDTEVMIMRDRSASDADDSDFSVSMATIMAGYDSATAELMVTEDMMPDSGTNDNMGEMLVLYGMVGDMETNSLTFTIWDQAVPALPLLGQLALALFLMLGGARLYRRRQG